MIKIENDIILDLAIGRSRKDLHWKNIRLKWSELVKKLSVTHYTAETGKEYEASKKDRQDEIKDIGGFVGGQLTGGRRLGNAVLHRGLITLDIDKAPIGFWDDFTMIFDWGACLYSTHKHRPEAPRYRLLLPLDKPVDPCQYEAIARWFAGKLGIDYFDNTGFQAHRLMYWPSTSKGEEFVFEYQDGALVDTSKILGFYTDYKDSSQWPVSKNIIGRINTDIKKQGDPLEKTGVIGAFCRHYSIKEAIEKFLPDIYEKCSTEDRYTFTGGSTTGGLVIYEDKFAYSHHGTDPVSGKLCNAFDLVRIHKFGHLDENVSDRTLKPPSFKAMYSFILEDEELNKQVGIERLEKAKQEFGEEDILIKESDLKTLGIPKIQIEEDENNFEWITGLERDQKNTYKSTVENILLILRNDPKLKNKLGFNLFKNKPVVLGNLPWKNLDNKHYFLGRNFSDADESALRGYLEMIWKIYSPSKVKDCLRTIWFENEFHPIHNYLNGLAWDRINRLDRLLINYFGVEDNLYNRTICRKWFVAGVARVFNPGIKFDYTLVLVGAEGIFKSTFFRILSEPWFTDNFSFHHIGNKQAAEQITGYWIVEIGELTGLKKTELEGIKAFLSRQTDSQRGAFKEFVTDHPRQNIFAGSTNEIEFLQGSTGNRRFWVARTNKYKIIKSIADLIEERDQIWAEAKYLWDQGETLYLDKELEKEAYKIQNDHTETDDRTQTIIDYLDRLFPENWDKMSRSDRYSFLNGDETAPIGIKQKNRITAAEIWTHCFNGNAKDMGPHNTKFIHAVMKKIEGWEPRSIWENGRQYRGYIRINPVHRDSRDVQVNFESEKNNSLRSAGEHVEVQASGKRIIN